MIKEEIELKLLRKELDEIYTPLEEAKKEIWRRWNDKALRKKVEEFLGGDIPEIFGKSPRASLGRHVLSPNFEFLHFLKLSKKAGLSLLCIEYLQDKFIARNIDKYYLCNCFFYNNDKEKSKNGIFASKIIKFDNTEGKKICELKTNWGESLVDFHHRSFDFLGIDTKIDRLDISDFFKKRGVTAEKYYSFYLSFFICFGVLFENYLLDKSQINFTKDIFLKNYKKVQKLFGLKPLIVPLVPVEEENDLHWRFYPNSIKKMMEFRKHNNK